MITFIIPTRNNLSYLKLAYGSIRRFYPTYEIIILDDNSDDGTKEWAVDQVVLKDPNAGYRRNEFRQVGHTILYDQGVELAKNDIFTIFHADMVCSHNYVENLLKWLKPLSVVAATRIEPPLHPSGREKITKDFGIYAENFKQEDFEKFVIEQQQNVRNKDVITKGVFAPWMMYKKDFQAIGGHDKFFAPFPYEDSDLFQRMILNHYEIIQSRDAFVYHFTCRGHRWTKKIQEDDFFYKLCCTKNMSHFLRKWGSWIENDELSYPVIQKKYDIGFVVKNCNPNLLGILEPWCSTIYADCDIVDFIKATQLSVPFDLTKRIRKFYEAKTNEILIAFDGTKLTQQNYPVITGLSKIITDSGDMGTFEHDIFSFDIRGLTNFENGLINNDSDYYKKQLRPISAEDPLCLDPLFNAYESLNKNV